MKKAFVVLIIAAMATLLGNLVLFDILSIIRNANTVQSQVEFRDSGGNQGSTLFSFSMIVDGYSQDFEDLCICRFGNMHNRSYSKDCISFEFQPEPGETFHMNWPRRESHLQRSVIYEAPQYVGDYLKSELFSQCLGRFSPLKFLSRQKLRSNYDYN